MKPNTENLRLGSKKKAEILWMKKDLSWFTKNSGFLSVGFKNCKTDIS